LSLNDAGRRAPRGTFTEEHETFTHRKWKVRLSRYTVVRQKNTQTAHSHLVVTRIFTPDSYFLYINYFVLVSTLFRNCSLNYLMHIMHGLYLGLDSNY
jgi:hypothetical protein